MAGLRDRALLHAAMPCFFLLFIILVSAAPCRAGGVKNPVLQKIDRLIATDLVQD